MIICWDQVQGCGCGKQNRDDARYCRHCGMSLLRALQILNPGEVIAGHYFIVREIGHGNYGAVYEAQDMARLNDPVALKQTFDPAHIAQYRAEHALLSGLQHDNLPCYYGVFEFEGSGYLVMEYVPGQSLQEVLDKKSVPQIEAVVLGYARQLCDALIYLHSQTPPIIHRDVKPDNVRLTPEGLIKLVDFGLVKRLPAGALARAAAAGSAQAGTPAYASPEQWGINGRQPEPRSDIYSLGATLYHLFTGREPIRADQRVRFDHLPPPALLNPALSRRVSDAVMAALSMNIDARPRDAQELWQRLSADPVAQAATAPSPQPQPQPVTQPSPRPRQRPRGRRAAPFTTPQGCSVRLVVLALALLLCYGFLLAAPVSSWFRASAPAPPAPRPTAPGFAPVPAPTPTATPTPAPDAFAVALVRVPAGEFVMGSTDAQALAAQDRCRGLAVGCEGKEYVCETPQHSATLGEYWIGLTEVTNVQFRAFVEGGGYENSLVWTGAGWQWRTANAVTQPGCWDDPALNRPDQPVVCVGWHEAVAYARWLTARTGREFHLPSEAEWEKAARGTDGRTYPWGEDPPGSLRANFCDAQCAHGRKDTSVDDGFARAAPVGSFPFGASTYGALDMAGNVAEWTASEYRRYPFSPGDGRASVDGSAARVLRGGSYLDTAGDARCAGRSGAYPDARNDLIGFRVASAGP